MKLCYLLLLLSMHGLQAQCLFDFEEALIKREIMRHLDKATYSYLIPGDEAVVDYVQKNKNGLLEREGTLRIKNVNDDIKVYNIGKWTSYQKGWKFEESEFDSCGNAMFEDFSQPQDSVKEYIKTTKELIDNTPYKMHDYYYKKGATEVIEHYFKNKKGKIVRHGLHKRTENGKVIFEHRYYMGKIVGD